MNAEYVKVAPYELNEREELSASEMSGQPVSKLGPKLGPQELYEKNHSLDHDEIIRNINDDQRIFPKKFGCVHQVMAEER